MFYYEKMCWRFAQEKNKGLFLPTSYRERNPEHSTKEQLHTAVYLHLIYRVHPLCQALVSSYIADLLKNNLAMELGSPESEYEMP